MTPRAQGSKGKRPVVKWRTFKAYLEVGPFDCVVVRFAGDNFAQDDRLRLPPGEIPTMTQGSSLSEFAADFPRPAFGIS